MIAERHKPVLFLASLALLLVVVSAYFTERNGLADEPGFLNPPYVLAHYGKLTFPVYPHDSFFDLPVITHPPIHTGLIGLLWRAGLPPYYAEATPTVLLLCLAILIVVYGAFPAAVKLGWLFGIGFLATSGDTMTLCFGSRPEGELLAAWLCGLLLLESGRLDNWRIWRLFGGAFFLAWASGTHYYAAPAFLGVLVYIAWAVRSLGWKGARTRVAAICAGGCIFGIPYLVLYVMPYYRDIRAAIEGNQGAGGIALAVRRHMDVYTAWTRELYRPLLIRKAMALGIPLWVFSTAMLASVRPLRGIAIAALPLQLAIFLFAWHKMPYYMVHEAVIFAAALACFVLWWGQWLIARYQLRFTRFYVPAAVAPLCAVLLYASPVLAHATVTFHQRFNEIEVAQAAGRRTMGPHARVGGRWWSWSSAGAEYWFDVEHDLLLHSTLFDRATYLSNLDAIEACDSPDEHNEIFDWWASGSLHLRGFFFGQSNYHLRCVQLSSQPPVPLVGFAEWDDQLYRFEQDGGDGYIAVTALCPAAGDDFHAPWAGSFSAVYKMNDGQRLVAVLAPQPFFAPAGRVGQGCRELSRISGTLIPDDRGQLVEWSRHNDAPIHFYRGIDGLPGYHGVGLPPDAIAPANAVPVAGVADLPAILGSNGGSVERSTAIRVNTAPGYGTFSAYFPIHNAASVISHCWVVLKLQVRQGRVGFGVATPESSLIGATKVIAPSPAPQEVALKVDDFHAAGRIVIFNQDQLPGQVDILDASVRVLK